MVENRFWRSQLWLESLGEPLLGVAEGHEGKVSLTRKETNFKAYLSRIVVI